MTYTRPTHSDPASDSSATDLTVIIDALSDGLERLGVFNVKNYGALGDGATDDTAAFNSAIAAYSASGVDRGVVLAPAGGTYMISATANTGVDSQPVGIQMDEPGLTLDLTGATLQTITNNAPNHSVIQVTEADCTVLRGLIKGERSTHIGGSGEWGYGIDVRDGADRFVVNATRCQDFWGDGFYIDGDNAGNNPADVQLIDVQSDNNRRQGLSIISAARPSVIRGMFTNSSGTLPQAGIVLEPSTAARSVTDAVIDGAYMQGNATGGLGINATEGAVSGRSRNCDMQNWGVSGAATWVDESLTTSRTSWTNEFRYPATLTDEQCMDIVVGDTDGTIIGNIVLTAIANYNSTDKTGLVRIGYATTYDGAGQAFRWMESVEGSAAGAYEFSDIHADAGGRRVITMKAVSTQFLVGSVRVDSFKSIASGGVRTSWAVPYLALDTGVYAYNAGTMAAWNFAPVTGTQVGGSQAAVSKLGFYGTAPVAKPTVTGSRGGNAALASALTQLAALGLITDSSS